MFASVQLIVALTPGTPSHCSVAAEPEYAAKAQSPSVVPTFAPVVNLALLDRIFISGTWFEVWFGRYCGNYYSAMDAVLAHAQNSCMSRHDLTLFQPWLIYCYQSFCLPSESRTATSNRRAGTTLARQNSMCITQTLHCTCRNGNGHSDRMHGQLTCVCVGWFLHAFNPCRTMCYAL